MNRFENAFKPPMWLTVSLLAAVVAGCGGGGDAGLSATGDSVPMAAIAQRVQGCKAVFASM